MDETTDRAADALSSALYEVLEMWEFMDETRGPPAARKVIEALLRRGYKVESVDA